MKTALLIAALAALAALAAAAPTFADVDTDDLARSWRPAPVAEQTAPEAALPAPVPTPSPTAVDTATEKRQREVATRFAPVIMQGVNNGTAGIDTPVDPLRPGEANLLYDVKETATHYYLTYLVYHRADEKRVGVGNHQHDLEGVTIAVAKPDGGRPERAVGVITLAHNEFFAHDLSKGEEAMDGQRVVVRIEPGAHGIYTIPAKKRSGFGKLRGWLDWRKQARDHLIAKGADRVDTYEVGSAAKDGQFGLRLLTPDTLAQLTALFANTPGNGAKTPDQWAQGDRVAAGELYADPESVFRRLLKWEDPTSSSVSE